MPSSNGSIYYWSTAYPEVRGILADSLALHLSDADIERLVERQLGIEAIDAEDFLSTLGNIWNQAAPVVAKVAPGVIQGAIAGGSTAGPYGALAGAGMGLLSGLLGGGGQPAPPAGAPPGQPAAPSAAPAAVAPPMAPVGGAAPPAAASLMQLLMRPEVQQALMAMLMGSAGKQQIPVGGTQVPVGAFTNAIGQLSQQASAEHHVRFPAAAAVPEYLFESNGALAVANPSDAGLRAGRLAELLDRADMERFVGAGQRQYSESYEAFDEGLGDEGYSGLQEGSGYSGLQESGYSGLQEADEGLDEGIDEAFDEAGDESAEDAEAVFQPAWT